MKGIFFRQKVERGFLIFTSKNIEKFSFLIKVSKKYVLSEVDNKNRKTINLRGYPKFIFFSSNINPEKHPIDKIINEKFIKNLKKLNTRITNILGTPKLDYFSDNFSYKYKSYSLNKQEKRNYVQQKSKQKPSGIILKFQDFKIINRKFRNLFSRKQNYGSFTFLK